MAGYFYEYDTNDDTKTSIFALDILCCVISIYRYIYIIYIYTHIHTYVYIYSIHLNTH